MPLESRGEKNNCKREKVNLRSWFNSSTITHFHNCIGHTCTSPMPADRTDPRLQSKVNTSNIRISIISTGLSLAVSACRKRELRLLYQIDPLCLWRHQCCQFLRGMKRGWDEKRINILPPLRSKADCTVASYSFLLLGLNNFSSTYPYQSCSNLRRSPVLETPRKIKVSPD
jgi:hypothetical protein